MVFADRRPDKWTSSVAARIVSLTFVEPGPTGSPSSLVTLASQRLASGVHRVPPPLRQHADDKIQHGSTLPRGNAPSYEQRQLPRRLQAGVAAVLTTKALAERPYETQCRRRLGRRG